MSATPSLPEKVLALDAALGAARIPHAFGGALALAYYAEPRTTIDIDINVFLEPEAGERVASALTPLGVEVPSGGDPGLERDAQTRWRWGITPIDLFFVNDPIHEAMREAVRRVPFGDARIPILAPEHLLICKLAFDRTKDWIDIEQMVFLQPDLDRAEIDRWVDRLTPAGDPRRARLERIFAGESGDDAG